MTELSIRPMPDEAYRARVELTRQLQLTAWDRKSSQRCVSRIQVNTNGGNASTAQSKRAITGSMCTGRYMVIQDDGRAVLPQIMKPGESCDIVLPIMRAINRRSRTKVKSTSSTKV